MLKNVKLPATKINYVVPTYYTYRTILNRKTTNWRSSKTKQDIVEKRKFKILKIQKNFKFYKNEGTKFRNRGVQNFL